MNRDKSAYVTLNLVWLVIICFLSFVGGMVLLSFADSGTMVCAICEEPLPLLSHSGVHEACLQARIEQYAAQLDPMAGMAGMESDGRPDAND